MHEVDRTQGVRPALLDRQHGPAPTGAGGAGGAGGADGAAAAGPAPEPSATDAASSLGHLPGLDGLRAVALVSVFVYHGGTNLFVGSFLAVSTFFTLSGFLITLLLLKEHDRSGRIRFGRFWSRRVRRLLPASVLAVALAGVLTLVVGSATQQRAFLGDGLATLFDVANWRFIVAGQSYAQLFSAPSPLQHAWSLGIEAQFYLLYAALAAVVLRWLKGSRRTFGLLLVGLIALTQLPVVLGLFDHDRFYYGTDSRAAEMLVGGLLAVLVSTRRTSVDRGWSATNVARIRVGGVVAAVAMVVLWVVAKPDMWWVDRGGMAVYSVLTAVVVLAAAVPRTAVSAGLALSPLQALGRISYGVYLFHWPILLWLSPTRVGWPDPVRLAVAAVITIGLAVLSYRLIESPIRRGVGLGHRSLRIIVPACLMVAIIPTVVVARTAPVDELGFDEAAGTSITDADRLGAPPDAPVTPVPTTAGPAPEPVAPGALAPRPVVLPSRPLRVLVVGDSTALSLGPLLDAWGGPDHVWTVAKAAISGCGIVRGTDVMNAYFFQPYDHCARWTTEWPALLEQTRPDLVVVSTGFWDATDRRFAGDDAWHYPDEPGYQDAIRADYALAVDTLTRTGAALAWLDHPQVWFNEESPWPLGNPQIYDPWRMDVLDDIQREVAAGRPGVQVVETERFFSTWPGGVLDPALRPDGLHVQGKGAAPYIDWLGPELVHAYWAARGQA